MSDPHLESLEFQDWCTLDTPVFDLPKEVAVPLARVDGSDAFQPIEAFWVVDVPGMENHLDSRVGERVEELFWQLGPGVGDMSI
jgi:hypothetical protein